MEKNNIYLGDCLEIMKNIPDKSIDMIFCDLSYETTAIACLEIGRKYIEIEKTKILSYSL